MAIEYKVTSKKVLAGADKGKTKYYAMASNTGKTTLDDLTKDIERASTVNGADIRAVLYSLLEIVPTHLEAGNIVELGEIGTFRINISSKGEDTEKKVTVNSIKGGKIIFSAGKKFKQVLQSLKYKKK